MKVLTKHMQSNKKNRLVQKCIDTKHILDGNTINAAATTYIQGKLLYFQASNESQESFASLIAAIQNSFISFPRNAVQKAWPPSRLDQ